MASLHIDRIGIAGMDWARTAPSMIAAFLASIVEFVEALTIVLAVGVVRGWRPALAGTGLGVLFLSAMVAAFGPALGRIPLHLVQLVVGGLLLLFGLRWLRKAILRSARIMAMHDEAAAYVKKTALLQAEAPAKAGLDRLAISTAFQITVLEGTEVVFIVIAVGAGGAGMLWPASLAAAAALLVVVVLGLIVHRPLSRIPENLLKFAVGVLLSAFGTFWIGEGLGIAWPAADWSIPALVASFLAVAVLCVAWVRAVVNRAMSAGAQL